METSLNEVVGLGLMVFGVLLLTVSLAGMLGFVPPPPWWKDAERSADDRT